MNFVQSFPTGLPEFFASESRLDDVSPDLSKRAAAAAAMLLAKRADNWARPPDHLPNDVNSSQDILDWISQKHRL